MMASSRPASGASKGGVAAARHGGAMRAGGGAAGSSSQAAGTHSAHTSAALRFTVRKSNPSYSQPPSTGPSTEPMAVATCRRAIRAPRSACSTRAPP